MCFYIFIYIYYYLIAHHSDPEESEDDDIIRLKKYESRYKDKPPALASAIIRIGSAAIIGFLFGFIMEKGRGRIICDVMTNLSNHIDVFLKVDHYKKIRIK